LESSKFGLAVGAPMPSFSSSMPEEIGGLVCTTGSSLSPSTCWSSATSASQKCSGDIGASGVVDGADIGAALVAGAGRVGGATADVATGDLVAGDLASSFFCSSVSSFSPSSFPFPLSLSPACFSLGNSHHFSSSCILSVAATVGLSRVSFHIFSFFLKRSLAIFTLSSLYDGLCFFSSGQMSPSVFLKNICNRDKLKHIFKKIVSNIYILFLF
jgi:hypothetical protein